MAQKKKSQRDPLLEALAGFDELSNFWGPLKGDIRKRLAALLLNPCEKTWDNAYSIIVQGPFRTLWQTWIAVDPTAPRTGPRTDMKGKKIEGWSRWPSTQEEVFTILRHAATHKESLRK